MYFVYKYSRSNKWVDHVEQVDRANQVYWVNWEDQVDAVKLSLTIEELCCILERC